MKTAILLVCFASISLHLFSQDCDSLSRKAFELADAGKFEEGLKLLDLAEPNCKMEGEKSLRYIMFLHNKGSFFDRKGDYKLALYYHQQVSSLRKEISGDQTAEYGADLNNIAVAYLEIGNYDSAQILFDKSLQILKGTLGEKNKEYITFLSNFASLYDEIGNSPKAIETMKKVLELCDSAKLDSFTNKILFMNNIAGYYMRINNYNLAFAYYNKALDLTNSLLGPSHQYFIGILNNLSNMHLNNNNYQLALSENFKAYNTLMSMSNEENPVTVACLNTRARIYSIMGLNKDALALNQRSLNITKRIRGTQNYEYAQLLNTQGSYYKELGNSDSANICAFQSSQIFLEKFGEKNQYYINSLINRAILKRYKNENDESFKLVNEALRLNEKYWSNENRYYYSILRTIGDIFMAENRFDSSIIYYEKSLEACKYLFSDKDDIISNLHFKIADAQYKNGNQSAAGRELQNSINYLSNFIKNKNYFLGSKIDISFIKTNNPVMDFYKSYKFSFSNNLIDSNLFANSLFLKSLSLNETKITLQSIRSSKDTSILNMFQSLNGLKNYLSKQYTLPLTKQAPNVKEKEAEANELEQQLALRSAAYRRYEQSINVSTKDIFKGLKAGEAAIEFTSFRFHNKYGWTDSTLYAAIILTKNNPNPQWVYLFEEKQIKQLLFNVHPNLLYSNAKIIQTKQPQYGDKLYNLIWKKMQPWLTGIRTVYFSPSGILNQVALGAIPFAGGTATIGNTYRLVQMGSTKNIVVQEPAIPLKDIALMGGIQYNADSASFAANITDSGIGNANIYTTTIMRAANKTTSALDYLPATLTEVDSITTTATTAGLGTYLYTNTTATEEMFKNLNGHSPSILHLATHGFYVPYTSKKANDDISQTSFSLIDDPMLRSGIALAGANLKWNKNIDVPNREDGIVTAYEIAQMDLSKTELVVLSACESGLGDIDGSEGVFGLQRGFKSAGVNKLILTLWQVPDKASMQFMTLFYREWLKEKKDIRTAFADTQKVMSQKYKAEPFKWAGFVLIE